MNPQPWAVQLAVEVSKDFRGTTMDSYAISLLEDRIIRLLKAEREEAARVADSFFAKRIGGEEIQSDFFYYVADVAKAIRSRG